MQLIYDCIETTDIYEIQINKQLGNKLVLECGQRIVHLTV